jgi:hypothetical protein
MRLVPHRLEVRAVVPFAPAVLGTREHLRTAPYDELLPTGGLSPTPAARAYRGRRRAVELRRRPAAAPAYKGSAPAGPRTGGTADRCTPAVGPCASSRAPPPLARVARSSAVQQLHRVYKTRPAPPHPPPRPQPRRTEPHRGQVAWAPPDGPHRRFSHPSATTNRRVVSPSTFSTHPPAESPTEWLNSGEPRRPAAPGTTLQNRSSFRGPHCERVTQIVKVLWLFLVNCVENHRKIRKTQN